MNPKKYNLSTVLDTALEGNLPGGKEIKFLLSLTNEADIALLHQAARTIRQQHFGNKIFLYGFLYFSTYCRNNCNFCHFRNGNTNLIRYRKTEAQIVESAKKLAQSGVHLIDLTMGEDPYLFESELGVRRLLRLIKAVRNETNLPVMISPGAVPDQLIKEFAKENIDWFACYQETHSRTLFQQLRKGQSYDERMNKKIMAKTQGMLIEEGLLTGVGEGIDDLVDSILKMRSMDADQVRVMTFVPQKGTPMAKLPARDNQMERMIISVLRLVFPNGLIPASLDVDGLDGLQKRLNAGANVVTSIVPSGKGFAGVANLTLDIEESRRTVESVLPILKFSGLEMASLKEYTGWMESRRNDIKNPSRPIKKYPDCSCWN